MSYTTSMIVLKSHVGSALKNQLQWDTLVSLFTEFCTTFEKAIEANHVLLDQLKIYREIESITSSENVEKSIVKEENYEDSYADDVLDENIMVDIKTEYVEETDDTFCHVDVVPEDSEDLQIRPEQASNDENNLEPNAEKVKCDICGKLISKRNWSRHLKTIHQNVPRTDYSYIPKKKS